MWMVMGIWVAVFGVFLGPYINEDSLFGLLVARDFHAGAPWNHLWFPDPANVAQVRSAFVAWWAPAQWVVPDLLHQAGLPLGWSLTLTSVIALGLGLVGWRRLYRRLGYREAVVALTLIAIVTSVYFWRRLAEYHGGEVLLFGVLPWIILGSWRVGLGVRAIAWLPVLFLLGGFVKLSFSISALAIVVFLWMAEHLKRPFSAGAWRAAGIAAASFGIFYAAFRGLYLGRGITPDACVSQTPWVELVFMPSGPLSFLISGQQLSGRLLGELQGPVQWLWGALASLAALAIMMVAIRRAPTGQARAAALAFCAINIAAITFLCWRGNRVWFIDRIFMPAGLLLLPAIIHLFLERTRTFARWPVIALFGAAAVYSLGHAFQYSRWLRATTAASPQHIRHPGLDEKTMRAWQELDTPSPIGATAFFTDPGAASLALEWPSWRAYVPPYSAICGMIDGGPPTLHGRPAVLRVVAFADSPPGFRAETARERFAEFPLTTWKRREVGRLIIWQSEAAAAPGALAP